MGHWFHDWTDWQPYDWRGTVYPHILDGRGTPPRQMSEARQFRRCKKCGKTQDEMVSSAGWPAGVLEKIKAAKP